MDFTTCR